MNDKVRVGQAQTSDDGVRWAELMARAQDGDANAYRTLLSEIVPYLRRATARQLRHRDDIEDVVQDILLTVHQVRATYDPGRPFKPWLIAIARRRMIDRFRRSARISANEVGFEDGCETFAEAVTNSSQVDVTTRELQAAIDQLPAGQRQAFVALKLEELSLKEAAVQTGMSVGALKVAVHRAVRALKAILFEEQGKR
jgi:RNA polymerase sigma factor (sigma-70 family)